jgi:PAS domain S-box-containing protein/putative nucleotidyltransferase with HDIG domain
VSRTPEIHILYIEDDAGIARLLQKHLARGGYRVDIASDGEEGIAKYRGGSYDILFVDQSLPDYDGLQVIRTLAAQGPLPPIVMITGTGDERVAVEAMKLGTSDYIVKDVDGGYLKLLPSVIEKVLQQRRAIEEKKRAEEALGESEEQFRLLADNAPFGISVMAPDRRFEYFNPRFTEIFGYTTEDIPDKDTWFEKAYPDAAYRKNIRSLWETDRDKKVKIGRENPRIFPVRCKNGRDKIIAFRTVDLQNGKQYLVYDDITDRTKAEEALRQSEERYRTLMDNIRLGINLIDVDYTILMVNAMNGEHFNKPTHEMIGKKCFREFEGRDALCPHCPGAITIATAQQADVEIEEMREDGSHGQLRVQTFPVLAPDGKVTSFIEVVEDITERKQMKETLQRTEAQLRSILEGASDGFAYVDREGRILFTNSRMKEILADPHPEGKPLSAFYDEENQAILTRNLAARWEGRGTIYELVLTDVTGHKHALVVSGTPYGDKHGIIQGSFGVYHDVTQERELQKVLSAHKEALKNSFFGITEALSKVIEDRDPYTSGHSIGVANLAEAIAHIMGLPEEQSVGLRIAGLLHDIGKMIVPVEILVNPGRLNEMELTLIKLHPQAGYDVIRGIDFPWPVAQAALQHHERLDGSGYPRGLGGDQIILEARILAVADVVDAMTHHRPYRPAFDMQVALEDILQGRGTLYDPQVVDACAAVVAGEGKEAFVISEYSTTSVSPIARRFSRNSSTLPTTTMVRASGKR